MDPVSAKKKDPKVLVPIALIMEADRRRPSRSCSVPFRDASLVRFTITQVPVVSAKDRAPGWLPIQDVDGPRTLARHIGCHSIRECSRDRGRDMAVRHAPTLQGFFPYLIRLLSHGLVRNAGAASGPISKSALIGHPRPLGDRRTILADPALVAVFYGKPRFTTA